MKLSDQEKRILATVELSADQTVPEIARKTRLHSSTVQRHLTNLIASGVIVGRTTIIDLARLGLVEHGFFVSLEGEAKLIESFLNELIKHAKVSWVAEVGAKYDLMFNVVASHPREVISFLDNLTAKYSGIFRAKEIIVRTERYRYWRRYLASSVRKTAQFALGSVGEQITIDQRDRVILIELSRTKLESFRELASRCDLPITSFLRRVQALRDSGLILGFGYRLNLDLLSVQQYRVLISVPDSSANCFLKLKKYCEDTGNIKLLTRSLGAFDFDLEVDIPSGEDIRRIVRDLKDLLHNIRPEIQTIPIFKHRKYIAFPVGEKIGDNKF